MGLIYRGVGKKKMVKKKGGSSFWGEDLHATAKVTGEAMRWERKKDRIGGRVDASSSIWIIDKWIFIYLFILLRSGLESTQRVCPGVVDWQSKREAAAFSIEMVFNASHTLRQTFDMLRPLTGLHWTRSGRVPTHSKLKKKKATRHCLG